jgi:ubiquinone/menaquinone biosynthesis C-methylase UbiE
MVYFSGGNELLNPEKLYQHVGLTQGMKVADLGCGGSGRFTITAAKLVGRKGKVYAVDILKSVLKEMARKARLEGVSNVKTVWANLEIYGATKIKTNELDVAFLINILFQSKEHENIIKESVRMLKSGGKLLVVDWKQTGAPFGPPVVDRVKPDKIKKIAKSIGLKKIDEFEAGDYHYGLVFQKV